MFLILVVTCSSIFLPLWEQFTIRSWIERLLRSDIIIMAPTSFEASFRNSCVKFWRSSRLRLYSAKMLRRSSRNIFSTNSNFHWVKPLLVPLVYATHVVFYRMYNFSGLAKWKISMAEWKIYIGKRNHLPIALCPIRRALLLSVWCSWSAIIAF